MRRLAAALVTALAIVSCVSPNSRATASPTASAGAAGLQKINHIIVIMQENRSFDEYFGLYPGADGLPRQNGQFTICVSDPINGGCDRPYHDATDRNGGGPHGSSNASADINAGKMDGFVGQAEKGKKGCNVSIDPN